jgi:hypothetical protein
MPSVKVLVVAAGLLLAGATRPALAGSPVPDPDGAADTSALRPPATAVPAPPPLPLAELRHEIGHSEIRVRVGSDLVELGSARADPAGVVFDPRDVSSYAGRRAPVSSPLGWDCIHGIEARKPCALRGAVAGMLVPVAILGWAAASGAFDSEGLGLQVIIPLEIAAGAAVGADIGALAHYWKAVWHRSPFALRAAR